MNLVAIFDKTTGVVRCTAHFAELAHMLGENEGYVEVSAPVADARYDPTTKQFTSHVDLPAPSYADLRRMEYPQIADYLDAVVKGEQAQIDAYIATCQAVKAKYPKS